MPGFLLPTTARSFLFSPVSAAAIFFLGNRPRIFTNSSFGACSKNRGLQNGNDCRPSESRAKFPNVRMQIRAPIAAEFSVRSFLVMHCGVLCWVAAAVVQRA